MSIRVTYYGHSCFTLEAENYRVAIDPYDDHVPGYLPFKLQANAVYCSHEHTDHNFVEGVCLSPTGNNPFDIKEIQVDHDDAGGTLRGKSMIRVFSYQGVRVVHFGDVGRMLTDSECEELKDADCVLIPVGGTYTVNAQGALDIVRAITPRVVIPMHYRCGNLGFDVIDTADEFLSGMENVARYETNTIEVDSETPAQTAVLKYLG